MCLVAGLTHPGHEGVGIAFVAGVMGWSMLDEDYPSAIERAGKLGVQFDFTIGHLQHSEHPNAVWIQVDTKSGKTLLAGAESIGGSVGGGGHRVSE